MVLLILGEFNDVQTSRGVDMHWPLILLQSREDQSIGSTIKKSIRLVIFENCSLNIKEVSPTISMQAFQDTKVM